MANITDLQSFLFETLQDIKSGKIDVEKAKSINSVAQTIVNSAKAEVDFASVIGNVDSKFFNRAAPPASIAAPERKDTEKTHTTESKRTLENGATLQRVGNKTVHRL